MRVAVVGLGYMGLTHAQTWKKVPNAELYAAVTGDASKRAGRFPEASGNLGRDPIVLDLDGVETYSRLEDALADKLVDAVDICLPTDLHAPAAIQSLRAGKHVLVEKPLALTEADALAVVEAAKASAKVVMAGHVLRFFPAYAEAKTRLRTLGRLRWARFERRCATPAWSTWLCDPNRSGGGPFDLLIHDADYLAGLLGMPQSISASQANDSDLGIDVVHAALQYPGCMVSLTGGWLGKNAAPFTAEFTLACDGGVLEYRNGELLEYRDGTTNAVELSSEDPFLAELAHFHECASRNASSTICPVEESVKAVRLMRSILAAVRD